MVSTVYLTDQMAGGRYRDVLEVAQRLALRAYHNKANAVAQMVRQSQLFQDELERLKREAGDKVDKLKAEAKKRPRKRVAGAA